MAKLLWTYRVLVGRPHQNHGALSDRSIDLRFGQIVQGIPFQQIQLLIICQATAMVDGQKYWDGAIQHNNPIEEVWAEKGDVRPLCVVSFGTGISARKETKSFVPVIGRVKRLAKNLKQTEERHRLFKKTMKEKNIRYFRFNPTTGNDAIGEVEGDESTRATMAIGPQRK